MWARSRRAVSRTAVPLHPPAPPAPRCSGRTSFTSSALGHVAPSAHGCVDRSLTTRPSAGGARPDTSSARLPLPRPRRGWRAPAPECRGACDQAVILPPCRRRTPCSSARRSRSLRECTARSSGERSTSAPRCCIVGDLTTTPRTMSHRHAGSAENCRMMISRHWAGAACRAQVVCCFSCRARVRGCIRATCSDRRASCHAPRATSTRTTMSSDVSDHGDRRAAAQCERHAAQALGASM